MKAFFTSLLIVTTFCAFAQKSPILDRKISVSFTNEKLTNVLNKIALEGNFSFSYNTSIVSDETISFSATNKTIREVLNQIFKGSMGYKEKSNHLILSKVPPKQSRTETTVVILSGYVEDAQTKEKVPD